MKKILLMMLTIVVFAGCSKEDDLQKSMKDIISSIDKSELSAIDLLSLDAWSAKCIYKYTQAGGKGDSKLYYDFFDNAQEGASKGASYSVSGGKMYEFRKAPLGPLFYYTYEVTGQGADFTVKRNNDGQQRQMTIVAYDDDEMVIEFYNPNSKEYPYTREYIVRTKGVNYFDTHKAYEELPEDLRP